MKPRPLHLSLLFVMFCLGWATAQPGNTNCGTCTPDPNCPSSQPSGGLCPETIPDAQVGEAYDESITFYLPEVISVTNPVSTDVTLMNVDIVELINLPTGLEWSCNNANCNYQPSSNPPASELGCIRFCGTPDVAPGNYTITIRILADVYVSEFDLNLDDYEQLYTVELTVLPPSNGIAFNVFTGCGSIADDLTATQDFNPDQPTEWSWDLGGGQTSSSKSVSYSYNSPGMYDIILETTVYNYIVTEICVTNITDGYCGDVEEAFCNCGTPVIGVCPDAFISIQGSNLATAPSGTSHCWSGLSIPTGGLDLEFTVWDEDEFLPIIGSPNDNLGNFTINIANGAGSYNFGNGNASGNVMIGTVLSSTTLDTLTVTVYEVPEEPMVDVNGTQLSVTNNNGYDIQWYLDGNPISGAEGENYEATSNGDYTVEFTNGDGCSSISQAVTVSTVSVKDLGGVATLSDIYPNPTNDEVFIQINMKEQHDLTLHVTDLMGRLVASKQVSVSEGEQVIATDVSHLDSGMYFIQIVLDNGEGITQKLNIQ